MDEAELRQQLGEDFGRALDEAKRLQNPVKLAGVLARWEIKKAAQLARGLLRFQQRSEQRSEKTYTLLKQEVDEFDAEIQSHGWGKLSDAEKAEITAKRRLLAELVEGRRGSVDEDRTPITRSALQAWEQGQMDKALKRVADSSICEPQYEFVFDDLDYEEAEGTLSQAEDHSSGDPEDEEDETTHELPVVRHREPLLALIRAHQVVIVAGETGSGKTTQLPQFLADSGLGKVACTQPRRLAAMSVAARVAHERQVRLGTEVGYNVRFEDRTSSATRIKYLTDGMLLREILADPKLSEYQSIMIDEAHERTLSTDVLLALLKGLLAERPELRLIISSATLNSRKFSDYFSTVNQVVPVYDVPGRRFNVEVYYTKEPEPNYAHAAILTIFQIHISQDGPGDILVFLPGQDEIESVAESLRETVVKLGGSIKELLIAPVYANMPPEQQARIFEPTPEGARKVVLATNIAETSLTIDGIVYVIDSGFVKQNSYNARTAMESLTVRECSQASANQRAGRAGRVAPGKCFRLYTKWAYNHELPVDTIPEILRTNLASVVLLLLSLGVENVLEFDLIDRPPVDSLVKAMEMLYSLGALNARAELTQTGRKLAEFPIDPMMAKAILASENLRCSDQVITVIAMLDELGSLYYRPRHKRSEADRAHKSLAQPEGDHFTLLELWSRWVGAKYSSAWARDHYVQQRALIRARNVRNQLVRLCKRVGIKIHSVEGCADSVASIGKAFVSGYFMNIARVARDGSNYMTARLNLGVAIHPSSALNDVQPRPRLLIYYELVETSKEYMRGCLTIDSAWVEEQVPHFYKSKLSKHK